MNYLEIEKVVGREILIREETLLLIREVTLIDGTIGRGMAPSGASTGEFEALELRDGDKSRYLGKGVQKAVENINTVINGTLQGMDASDTYAIDKAMIDADGTKDKSNSEQMQFLPFPSHVPERQQFHWIFRFTVFLAGLPGTVFRFR